MNNDDPRLNALIKQGKDGEVVVVGVPFGYSRARNINKGGEENGPCCLRRFFPKVGPLINPEYQIDITNIRLTDFGNIDIEKKEDSTAPERAISKVSDDIIGLLKNNQVPFILGGAKQGTYGASLAASQVHQNHRHFLMAGKPTLRRPYDQNKLSSDCLMTMLMKRPHKLTLFGASTHYFPQNYDPQNYEKNFNLVSYQEIRIAQWSKDESVATQGGYMMRKLIDQCEEDNIHISLSVEVIERFRGCRDVMTLGLALEEIMEIFILIGASKKVFLVDICEFNPSVEDYESSILILNLLYYFLMGWTKRQK